MAIVFAELNTYIEQALVTELPALIGGLEQARALAWSRLAQPAPAPSDGDDALLNVKETSKLLNVPVSYVYDLARQHKLPGVKVGKYLRFRRHLVLEWVNGLGIDTLSTVLISSTHDVQGRGQGLAKAAGRYAGSVRPPRGRPHHDRLPVGTRKGVDSSRNGTPHPGANQAAS